MGYPRRIITYKGLEFVCVDSKMSSASVCVVTNDSGLAQRLGFESAEVRRGQYHFKKWISAADVERWVDQNAFGIYKGVRVEIITADDNTCFVTSTVWIPGLDQTNRSVWQGVVPIQQVTSITIEEHEEDLRQFRPRKRRTWRTRGGAPECKRTIPVC